MRVFTGRIALLGLAVSCAVPAWASYPVLGNQFAIKAKPGVPTSRTVHVKSQERDSLDPLVGDPQANGATVQILINGVTSTNQTFTLPAGTAWRRSPTSTSLAVQGWRYRDGRSLDSAVVAFDIKISKGRVTLAAKISGRRSPVTLEPPNPGSYAGMVFTIGGGGETYCSNFLGDVGGIIGRNDATQLKVKRPTSEGVCPSGTPVCGDNVVDSPTEVCDGSNDLACPGLCGSNGLPCQCPLCGDGVIDAGEACDHAALGSCTEGCSNACECTTCGNGVAEYPAEACEDVPDEDASCPGECAPQGAPNQCQCPLCGDGLVNQLSEQCDGASDGACPGQCLNDSCQCAVCGNDLTESPVEQCDGLDDGDCPGLCQVDCTCP